jgi:hypothetical protein
MSELAGWAADRDRLKPEATIPSVKTSAVFDFIQAISLHIPAKTV